MKEKQKRSAAQARTMQVLQSPLFIFLVMAMACSIFPLYFVFSLREEGRDHDVSDFQADTGLSIPGDATDVMYETTIFGRWGGYIKLSFKAPPQTSLEFLNTVCGGIWYAGYNPFTATDSKEFRQRAHRIKQTNFTYYSTSPNTPDSLLGSRCNGKYGQMQQVSVDTSNPDRYVTHFERSEGFCELNPPCISWHWDGGYVNPVSDLPLMAIGLELQNKNFVLVYNEICFDTVGSYFADWYNFQGEEKFKWKYLERAEIQIMLDDYAFPPGLINDGHYLIRKVEPDEGRHHRLLNYCLKQDWAIGTHEVKVHITTTAGQILNYAFSFEVLQPLS